MARDLKSILTNQKKPQREGHIIHVGFTLSGEEASLMREALRRRGVTNIAQYVKELVLRDLIEAGIIEE